MICKECQEWQDVVTFRDANTGVCADCANKDADR